MHSSQSRCIRNEELVDSAQCTAVRSIDVKSVQIKTKYVKKRKKRDEFKKNVCKRNKKRYLFSVYFNSTPDAQEMAFKTTRNMPFSLVLQKLSSF